MSAHATDLAGRLQLRLGDAEPVRCVRPVVSALTMRRLTQGRRAVLLPELLGALFTLCAPAHRMVSRQAILAALESAAGQAPQAPAPASLQAEQRLLALQSARDHLQRLALDLPSLWPVPGAAPDPAWLRLAPLWSLAGEAGRPGPQRLAADFLDWLAHRLLGQPAGAWLARWRADPDATLTDWCAPASPMQGLPLARWLAGVRADAKAIQLPCRHLDLLAQGPAALRALGQALASDAGFAERPVWQGAPAETGAWTRPPLRLTADGAEPLTAWHRLGSRLAEVAALALAAHSPDGLALPALGALRLGPGQALAWCEMSRGLLLHWVQLEPGPAHRDSARVADYRVLAPTEWNFHPEGTLAQALRARQLDARAARLATLALDPCVGFDLVDAAHGAAHA